MADIIIGAQWGDEGKGKLVDVLASDYDIIVRFQGGNNAGHTVVVGDDTYKLHLLPSGMIQGKQCVIGNGVVIDPDVLVEEIQSFPKVIEDHQLMISEKAHVIFFYHKILDMLKDQGKIGTTGRGIGPCYKDKAARTGIRIKDLQDKLILKSMLGPRLREVLRTIRNVYHVDDIEFKKMLETDFKAFTSEGIFFDINKITEHYYERGKKLSSYIHDTTRFLVSTKNKKILYEGAQGVMLDIDHGTYPYVTSSNPTIGSALSGGGMYTEFGRRIGIVKAYTTRVGKGPFYTELSDWRGEALGTKGNEFGTTTGRKRRCGWLDLAMIRYAIMLNGFNELSITKLDVLNVMDTIKICTGYQLNGEPVMTYPTSDEATPVYIELPGWKEDISNVRTFEELPENAKVYIRAIEEITEVSITSIGVGPKRDQIILR